MADSTLRIVLHAPTAGALLRARRNAGNLFKDAPGVTLRILINGEAVSAALDNPDDSLDRVTLVCPNSLRGIGREAPAPLTVLEQAGVLALVHMQADGWQYVRA